MTYGKRTLIAVDQLINVGRLAGRNHVEPGVQAGSRGHDVAHALYRRRGGDFFGDVNHGEASFDSERVGRQLPPELRRQI